MCNVSARRSSPGRILGTFATAGQDELKYRAARGIHIGPESAPVGFDDRTADGQAHPGPVGFRGEESLEDTLEILRIDARAGIAHSDENLVGLRSFGADRQVSC